MPGRRYEHELIQAQRINESGPCRIVAPCYEHGHCTIVEFQPPLSLTSLHDQGKPRPAHVLFSNLRRRRP